MIFKFNTFHILLNARITQNKPQCHELQNQSMPHTDIEYGSISLKKDNQHIQ